MTNVKKSDYAVVACGHDECLDVHFYRESDGELLPVGTMNFSTDEEAALFRRVYGVEEFEEVLQ